MKTRKMENTDYSSVAVMLQELYTDHTQLRPNYYDKINTEELPSLFDSNNLKIVAIEGDVIIGFIRGETITKGHSVVAIIHDVFVNESNRGKGTGSVLMQSFSKEAELAGATILQLQVDTKNHNAVSFWKSEGFDVSHFKMFKEIK